MAYQGKNPYAGGMGANAGKMMREKTSGRHSSLALFALFLMFSPVGVLLMMVQTVPMGWLAALVSGALSGLISVGWAYSFMRERMWVLIPTIGLMVMVPRIFKWLDEWTGILDVGMDLPPSTRLAIMAGMCIVFSAFGYVFFDMQMRKTERKTARAMAELELASDVHRKLVPSIDLTTRWAQVRGRSIASSAMGGDLIDAIEGERGLMVLLGDVSGHGVGAGIVMAMLKASVRTAMLHGGDTTRVLDDANRVLEQLTEPHMFATFVAIRIGEGGDVEYSMAGHLPIFHRSAATGAWAEYPNSNLPLGIDAQERYASGNARLAPGDVLAVFTDGLTEVQNAQGRELGLEGVAALLARAKSDSLAEIERAVMEGVRAHGAQADDQSLVLVRLA
jgi:hypothetical protein